MATASPVKPRTPAPPSAVAALLERLAPARARRDALTREDLEIFRLLNATDTAASPVDVLRARARRPAVHQELALAEAEVQELEGTLRAATEAERQARRDAARERLRAMLPGLDRALAHVAEVLQPIAALDLEAGTGVATAWEMFLGEPSRESLLETWRRFCRQEGLL